MTMIISTFISLLSFRFRSRAGLELELVALRHQVAVLRRQRKGRVQLFSTDRVLWVWLYRIWPRALDVNRPTPADARAMALLAREQERIQAARVDLRLASPDARPAGDSSPESRRQ